MHTTRANDHLSGVSSTILAFASALLSPLARRIARARDRRKIRAMLELDDRTLRDIGISYGDVYEAAMAGGEDKPSDILRRRRADRFAQRGPLEPVRRRRFEPARVNHLPCVSSALSSGHWQS